MKINKIELDNSFEEPKIVVTVEGYPHAQPVFPADTKPEDLKGLLEAWKIKQDEVDVINANPPAKPEPIDITELKKLEGEVI